MADMTEEEAGIFDEDATIRRELERVGRIAAGIVLDLQDRGPLYQYVADRQTDAVEAMRALIRIDPRDTAGIVGLQSRITAWIDACEWIGTRIEQGEEAERQINEEYGTHGEEKPSE